MALDFNTAVVTVAAFVLGGAFNALIATATGEYRARQDERRAIARESREAIRAARVARIDATRDMWARRVMYLGARALGDEAGMRNSGLGVPDAHGAISVVGDPDVVREAMEVTADFLLRPPKRGMSDEDSRRLYGADRRVTAALNAQEDRALRGEPLLELDTQSYDSILGDEAHIRRKAAATKRWAPREKRTRTAD
jgi:hypothetical protein